MDALPRRVYINLLFHIPCICVSCMSKAFDEANLSLAEMKISVLRELVRDRSPWRERPTIFGVLCGKKWDMFNTHIKMTRLLDFWAMLIWTSMWVLLVKVLSPRLTRTWLPVVHLMNSNAPKGPTTSSLSSCFCCVFCSLLHSSHQS